MGIKFWTIPQIMLIQRKWHKIDTLLISFISFRKLDYYQKMTSPKQAESDFTDSLGNLMSAFVQT